LLGEAAAAGHIDNQQDFAGVGAEGLIGACGVFHHNLGDVDRHAGKRPSRRP